MLWCQAEGQDQSQWLIRAVSGVFFAIVYATQTPGGVALLVRTEGFTRAAANWRQLRRLRIMAQL
jgi:hypothetical protein